MTDQPPSRGKGDEPQRIVLPKNIGQTLRYLDDIDLEVLQRAVEQELRRRRAEKGEEPETPAPEPPPSKAPRATTKTAARAGHSQLPTGKASLIKASFQAGMKPTAIARKLRMSLADVNRALEGAVKPKR